MYGKNTPHGLTTGDRRRKAETEWTARKSLPNEISSMRFGVSFGHVAPFKHRQISIERPQLSIAAAVSRAFWSLPVLALPASIFSGQLGILPLSQPSVAHLPPPAAPLAAALPPHPASGSRNTCQGRGHVAAPRDQLPNTPPGKKVELHRPDRRQRSGSSTTASSERRRRGRTHRQ